MGLLFGIVRWFVFGLCTVVWFGGLVRWFVFGIIYDGFVVWYR